MPKSQLIILEGPSGSGKSTLANRLLERFPEIRLVQKSLVIGDQRTDLYSHELDWISWQNDLDKTVKAINLLYEGDDGPVSTVLVDRLAISQAVYGPLRDNLLPEHLVGYRAFYSWYKTFGSLWEDLALRDRRRHQSFLTLPEVKILYVNPGSAVIRDYRDSSDRGYGFPIEQEILAYERAIAGTPFIHYTETLDVQSLLFRQARRISR